MTMAEILSLEKWKMCSQDRNPCSEVVTVASADRALPRAGLFAEVYSIREMGFDLFSRCVSHALCILFKAKWPGLKSTCWSTLNIIIIKEILKIHLQFHY